ncbi:autoinhibited Ca2+-ATPase 11 [Prunus dulcis]|uniref:Autoinhibited Ca2+-ATPase 11 n=1 Tax=Prunus dulcis TaxID=3755 RepID=A0A4Y1RN62_PRUDU|nr:autoinhibited Ca2+-ATPase 11 [Prunus dulcis]
MESLFCYCRGDLELPSADEEMMFRQNKPLPRLPSPPPTKLKKLKKRSEVEYFAAEETAAVPATTSGTDEELREAFEEVEQEKELQELEEVPRKGGNGGRRGDSREYCLGAEATKGSGAELTSSELALFEDAEAEHSTAAPEAEDQVERSVSDPVDQAELTVVVPEAEVGTTAAAPVVVVEVPKAAGALAAMPIHSFPGSSATASFADPELEEFEAMDLDAQLDRLEKLSSPPARQNLEQCRRPWRG